jgi:glycosyltransferase involved in cell wall biosynthesis
VVSRKQLEIIREAAGEFDYTDTDTDNVSVSDKNSFNTKRWVGSQSMHRLKKAGQVVEVAVQPVVMDPVIVTGTPCSGTSMVAGLLAGSGIRMGNEPHGSDPERPSAGTVDPDFRRFHDSCLKRRGMSRSAVTADPTSVALTDDEVNSARGLVRDRIENGAETWGWHDPSTCLFLDSWFEILPDARFVIPFRDPMAVLAASLRNRDSASIADPIATLKQWCAYTSAIIQAVESTSNHGVMFDVETLFSDGTAVATALTRLGIDIQAQSVDRLSRDETFVQTVDSSVFPGLLRIACPEAAELLKRLNDAAMIRPSSNDAEAKPISLTAAAAGIEWAANACTADTSRATINSMLIAALTAQDPAIAMAVERVHDEDRIARASVSNNGPLRSGTNEISVDIGGDETLSDPAGEDNPDGRTRSTTRIAETDTLSAARLESTLELLERARRRAAQSEQEADRAVRRIETLLKNNDNLIREREAAVKQWQRYRRRWPPYVALALARRGGRMLRRFQDRWSRPWANEFGASARVIVLNTGLPAPGEDTEETVAAVAGQSRPADLMVWPGWETDALADNHDVKNWWAPDLPLITRGYDLALILHPEWYGPGPLWQPQAMEMIRAAFASDPTLASIVFVGREGAPEIGGINHLIEADAETLGTLDEQVVAAAFTAPVLRESFCAANLGEQRELISTLQHVAKNGKKVLVAPRTFPLKVPAAGKARTAIGKSLPKIEVKPGSEAPIRALYVSQWVECGGADKGILDLVCRSNPHVVRFSMMTTAAAEQSWAPRLAGHVDEMIHLGDHLPLPADKRFPAFLAEYVRRRNIELIHIMHSLQGYDAMPAIRQLCPDVRIIDQCHILERPEWLGGGHPVYSTVNYKNLFDHRTVTSEWLSRHLVKNYGVSERNISVIYTGVDAEREFNPDRYRPGVFREDIDVPRDAPLVVFLGRLHDQKRPMLFAKVAARVSQLRPELNARFVLVGDGVLRPRVEAERRHMTDPSRLILAGEVGHSAPVLRDSDLMLMLSEREGLAYVSYEAMSMGVPQIFTDVNAQSELVTPEVGTLLDPTDVEKLVDEAVNETIRLLEDDDAREEMGRAARARILQHFTIDRMVDAYETLYTTLVTRGGASSNVSTPLNTTTGA